MKNFHKNNKLILRKGIALVTCGIFILLLIIPARLYSQENEAPKKTKARIRLAYFQDEEGVRSLQAKVTTKIEKKWQPVTSLSVSIYKDSISKASLIKTVDTDQKGIGEVAIPDKYASPDTAGFMKFVGVINPNERHKTADREIEVKDLDLSVKYKMEDSVGFVSVLAVEPGKNGQLKPVEDLEVGIYVKRTFSLLKLEDVVTDKNGKIKIEIPKDIPGDKDGLLEIIPKVDDNELFGTVIANCVADCGIPLKAFQSNSDIRELWSPNAPLWMVITFGVLMTIVWGHFYFFVYLLYRIKKTGSKNADKNIVWDA